MPLILVALAAALQLPPIAWTCPMHPEIVTDARGACPICGMPLEPVRLDSVWSCPVHAVVAEPQAGRCRICGRDLVRVTMAVTWSCPDRPGQLTPARCADGSAPLVKYTPRPHGNHNPQHGGAFFMAPDNWHHLEGVYPRAGVFRVYLYDEYSRPLPADQARRVTGRVEVGATSVPLAIARGGRYLETRLPESEPPIELTAKLRFRADAPEDRFDFGFSTYSTESVGSDARALATGGVGARRTPIEELHERAAEIKRAIDRRAYSEIWVPALQAKDVALAIDAAAASGPDAQRDAISAAVKKIVQAAWMLDGYGDVGNADQIADAYARFTAAVAQLDAAGGAGKR